MARPKRETKVVPLALILFNKSVELFLQHFWQYHHPLQQTQDVRLMLPIIPVYRQVRLCGCP